MILLIVSVASFTSFGQSSETLTTDDGQKTVSIDANDRSEIAFTYEEWTAMGNIGNKVAPVGICIKIASRKKNCNGGIGFRCEIFDCDPTELPPSYPQTRSTNRQQHAVATFYTNYVSVKFDNPIDWNYLSTN